MTFSDLLDLLDLLEIFRPFTNSDSLNVFKFSLLKFVRPVANSVFEINNN